MTKQKNRNKFQILVHRCTSHKYISPALLCSGALIYALLFANCAYADVVDSIVAVVNDDVISQGEVEAVLGPLQEQVEMSSSKSDVPKRIEALRQDIIRQLIDEKIIVQEAKRIQVKIREEEVDNMVSELSGRFKTEEEFEDTLLEQNMTLEKLKNKFKDQIMAKKLIAREVRSKVIVTPKDITEYYESHKDEFIEPEKLKVRHILLRVGGTVAKETALKKAEDVIALIKTGKDFGDLARRYSEGPNADNGGDMGYIKRGQLMSKIDDAIFILKPGDISGIIETELGYHIFKIEDRKVSESRSLDEARSQIEDALYRKKAEKRYNEWIEGLKKNAYILIK